MKTAILKIIAKFLLAPVVLLLGWGGYTVPLVPNQIAPAPQVQKLGGYNPTGGSTYHLNASISSTQTTISLSSFLEPISSTPYTMALINSDIAYGTIQPQSSNSEFISFTGITQNSDGTATLTGVTRGLARSYPFTASSTFQLPHAGQSIFILSATPQAYNEYVTKRDNETISGAKTFTATSTFSSTSPAFYDSNPNFSNFATTTLASTGYVAQIAFQGAATATNAVAGITRLSVAAANANIPIAVGDNDTRVPTAGQALALVGSFGTPGSSNKYLTQLDATNTQASSSAVVRYTATGQIFATTTPVLSTDATSKGYVDGLTYLTFNTGSTTKTVSDASFTSTTTIAHGLGRIPKLVTIDAQVLPGSGEVDHSYGTYNGTIASDNSWAIKTGTGVNSAVDNGFIVDITQVGGGSAKASITMDATNITLSWVKSGSPLNIANIIWTAQ